MAGREDLEVGALVDQLAEVLDELLLGLGMQRAVEVVEHHRHRARVGSEDREQAEQQERALAGLLGGDAVGVGEVEHDLVADDAVLDQTILIADEGLAGEVELGSGQAQASKAGDHVAQRRLDLVEAIGLSAVERVEDRREVLASGVVSSE